MQNVYNNINSPEELLDFMNNNFSYGYVDFAGGIHDNFDPDWGDDYCLQIDDD